VPARWKIRIDPWTADGSGEETPVVVHVETSNDTWEGRHTLTITASEDGEVVDSEQVSVDVTRGRPAGAGNDRLSPAMTAARAAVDGHGGAGLAMLAAVAVAAFLLRRRERQVR
jgi:hypothetical protein